MLEESGLELNVVCDGSTAEVVVPVEFVDGGSIDTDGDADDETPI